MSETYQKSNIVQSAECEDVKVVTAVKRYVWEIEWRPYDSINFYIIDNKDNLYYVKWTYADFKSQFDTEIKFTKPFTDNEWFHISHDLTGKKVNLLWQWVEALQMKNSSDMSLWKISFIKLVNRW